MKPYSTSILSSVAEVEAPAAAQTSAAGLGRLTPLPWILARMWRRAGSRTGPKGWGRGRAGLWARAAKPDLRLQGAPASFRAACQSLIST